jgi:8-oxo-dGTP pyrophosphatase MutT (NUDIX family)
MFKNHTISYGIILFTTKPLDNLPRSNNIKHILNNYNIDDKYSNNISILLIQRNYSMAYIDLIKGKYPDIEPAKSNKLKVFFSEITENERQILKTKKFHNIWSALWKNHFCKYYHQDKPKAMEKFMKLNLEYLLNTTESKYLHSEFGIPKGRKNNNSESNIECAKREVYEETRLTENDYTFISNDFLSEEFLATNNYYYKHIYYIAEMKENSNLPIIDPNCLIQLEEVKDLAFFNINEIMAILRPYDIEKKKIILQAYDIIQEYLIKKTKKQE